MAVEAVSKRKIRKISPEEKRARRGKRQYPLATLAPYGPDNTRASKVAVCIWAYEGAEPIIGRWFSQDTDVRLDPVIGQKVAEFLQSHGVKTVIPSDEILGCPHEEGIDYPEGETCPECPFWANRDRFTHEIIQ